jgi:hypothetical protein
VRIRKLREFRVALGCVNARCVSYRGWRASGYRRFVRDGSGSAVRPAAMETSARKPPQMLPGRVADGEAPGCPGAMRTRSTASPQGFAELAARDPLAEPGRPTQRRVPGLVVGAPCASWPVRGQDNYRGPWNATTKNPILLIGTRHDPRTPYINAVRSARRLGNAVLLTHDGYGDVSFHDPSACVEQARVAYLVKLVTPPKGTVCRSDKKPFDPGFG